MKKLLLVIVLVLAAAPTVAASRRDFARVAALELPAVESNYFEAEVPLKLTEGTEAGDLRIFDKNDLEMPYLVDVAKYKGDEDLKQLVTYPPKEKTEGKQVLQVDVYKSGLTKINEIIFDIQEADFNNNLAVFCNQQPEGDWLLVRDHLKILGSYKPGQNLKLKHTRVITPEINCKFLRFEIELRNNQKSLHIDQIYARFWDEKGSVRYNQVPMRLSKLELRRSDSPNYDYWLLKSGGQKHPLESIKFDFEDDNFYREASLYCAKTTNIQISAIPKLKLLTSVVLSKHGEKEKTEIDAFGSSCPYYFLQIARQNSPAIQPVRATGLSKRLLIKFILEEPYQAPLALYAKSKQGPAPDYDLAGRLLKGPGAGFQSVQVGPVQKNPFYEFSAFASLKFRQYLAGMAFLLFFLISAVCFWRLNKKPDSA